MSAASTLPTELILLPSLRATRGPNGGLVLTRKYMTGAAEFGKTWPGPVSSLVRLTETPGTDMDHQEFMPDSAETRLELRPDGAAALTARLQSAALVVAFLSRDEAPMLQTCRDIGVPVVFVSEYSPKTERQILDAEVSNPILRLRRKLWLWRTERIRRALLAKAQGLQCNGTPTFDLYKNICRDRIIFFDNRVRIGDVVSEAALKAKTATLRQGKPLRLAFSGRMVAMKGVMELPRVAEHLMRAGVPFTFNIFGRGPLKDQLQSRIDGLGLSDRMVLNEVLDFDTGWVPYMRSHADLFVCCHPQGDPSCTYAEVLSCGVPIAGYSNEAFEGILSASQAGWDVPIFDHGGLARVIGRLHTDRDSIIAATTRARDFALNHGFEATFADRVTHFIRCSRLPDAVKAVS